jgi:DNA replication protein DnaC
LRSGCSDVQVVWTAEAQTRFLKHQLSFPVSTMLQMGDPTLADAILDRLIHNAYRIELTGESMRKRRTLDAAA